MADFRKWLIAFAAIALLLSFSSSANAAGTLTCGSTTGSPTIVRAEGVTELAGDILITCTGGTATPTGSFIPQSNVTLSLNTNITSRLLGGGYIDALLIIDEAVPGPGTQNPPVGIATIPPNPAGFNNSIVQSPPCFSNTFGASSSPVNCNVMGGTTAATDPYDPAVPQTVPPGVGNPSFTPYNVFVARQAGANTVTWLGVPIDPPGTNGARSIRLTNIRANACQLGVSSSLVPTQITAFIGINGSQAILLTFPQVTVAFIQTGLVVTAPTASTLPILQQCINLNTGGGGAGGNFFSSSAPAGTSTFTIRVQEGFAASFKRRVAVPAAPNPPAVIGLGGTTAIGLQNIPGFAYNTESGFVPSATALGIAAAPFGLADNGTRILLRFNNVGAGVRIVVGSVVPLTLTDNSTPGNIGRQSPSSPSNVGGFTGGFLQLLGGFVDQFGNAGSNVSGFSTATTSFTNLAAPNSTAPFNGGTEIPVSNGTAQAVYEVVNSDTASIERANIPVGIAFTSNTSQNLPGPGTVTANVSFAPIGPVSTAYNSADPALPIPRFCDSSTAKNVFSILACTCNLLFPFVTNQSGFDTGIAIANTTQDPFGTAPQSGVVTLNYYGNTTGGGAAPPAQVSTAVTAGSELTFTLAGGGTNGITATPGFQGYIIATAKFQFCHAFAFISLLGGPSANNGLSEGYLAIQLDNQGPGILNRTGITGESDAH